MLLQFACITLDLFMLLTIINRVRVYFGQTLLSSSKLKSCDIFLPSTLTAGRKYELIWHDQSINLID